MSDLATSEVFADGEDVTGARLNNAFASAAIQVGFITGKAAITPVAGTDYMVFYDASGTVLGKCLISALPFPASVTGIRLGAGAGADTAAKPKDFASAPTSSTPVAGAVTMDCSLNNGFSVTFVANTTITLSNISDGDLICVQVIQDGTGSRLLTLVTTQTLMYEGNTAYALSVAANSLDFLFFKRFGSNILTWIKKDFGP